jgi:hypothetical protein
MWFNLSAARGDKNAPKYRNLAAQKMTPSQIEKAQDLAMNFKESGKAP